MAGSRDDAPLYGAVYYFHSQPSGLDADNLSKPVWDALQGVAYPDDSRIRLRHAGIVDLRAFSIDEFDLSRLPDAVAERLFTVIGSELHVLSVEIGILATHMFEFGRTR